MNSSLLILCPSPNELRSVASVLPGSSLTHHEKGAPIYQWDNGILTSCGVGPVLAAMNTMRLCLQHPFQELILLGIAGTFDEHLAPILSEVAISEETLLDFGREHATLATPFSPAFCPFPDQGAAEFPTSHLKLLPPTIDLPSIRSVTVSYVTQSKERKQAIFDRHHPQIENMEGAAVAMVCHQLRLPFRQYRVISNIVGEPDRSRWHIDEAIAGLASLSQRLFSTHPEGYTPSDRP
jgi:futalosine hydrolase